MKEDTKLLCRLPPDIKAFIEQQAAKYGASMNSEVIRSIRERMERVAGNNPASVGQ